MPATGNDAFASLVGANATAELGRLVSRRASPLFLQDIGEHEAELGKRIGGRRILVVGGGGSIGSATTALLLKYAPAAVHVVDISENYLVELVRTLRGRPEAVGDAELKTIALDYGGPIMARMLAVSEPFDVVLNFAALKHVRSEKDVFSLLQMLQTNVVAHARFKENLARWNHGRRYFAVSTDKAANPSSMMGASKRLMEDIAFEVAASGAENTTSTRFANVAFSNGSLLQGFLQRLAKGQPIAAPRDTRRYFVTEEEAGQLCLIAAFLTPDQHIAIPRLAPDRELQLLQDVAARVIEAFGYTPEFYDDELKAKRDIAMLRAKRRWPLLMTPLDTSGEKPFEEFFGEGEQATEIGFGSILAVQHLPSRTKHKDLLEKLQMLIEQPDRAAVKADIVGAIKAVLPGFAHRETGRSLDERL
jgi:FlaA1/EpsC-like NDP-sugar epimerase